MTDYYSQLDFFKDFPNNDACLEYVWCFKHGDDYECKNCGRMNLFKRIRGRKAYHCCCGNQINPLANTIFHKSSTSLQSWFYIIYLMSQSKNGIAAKEVERLIQVSYNTALRIK